MSERGVVSLAGYDERRNTSRVFDVPPGALDEALEALDAWRRREPAHAAWVLEGAPRLTHAEHELRFGEPYSGHRSRSTKPASSSQLAFASPAELVESEPAA